MHTRTVPALIVGLLFLSTDRAAAADALFVADWGRDTVWRVDEAGNASLLASGTPRPIGLALDAAGNVYVGSGWNAVIRRVAPDGTVTSFAEAPPFPMALAFDSAGNLFASADGPNGSIWRVGPGGSRTAFATGLYQPRGLAFDPTGVLYVAIYDAASGRGGISRVAPDGTVTPFATALEFPTGVAFGPDGNLYVTESPGRIQRFNSAGVGTLVATVPPVQFQPQVQLGSLAFGEGGDLYVADSIGGVIRRVAPSGAVTTFASGFTQPSAVAIVPEPAATLVGCALLAGLVRRRRRVISATHAGGRAYPVR